MTDKQPAPGQPKDKIELIIDELVALQKDPELDMKFGRALQRTIELLWKLWEDASHTTPASNHCNLQSCELMQAHLHMRTQIRTLLSNVGIRSNPMVDDEWILQELTACIGSSNPGSITEERCPSCKENKGKRLCHSIKCPYLNEGSIEAYAIKGPDGVMYRDSVRNTEQDSKDAVFGKNNLIDCPEIWVKAEKEGYRCIRVRITPMEEGEKR